MNYDREYFCPDCLTAMQLQVPIWITPGHDADLSDIVYESAAYTDSANWWCPECEEQSLPLDEDRLVIEVTQLVEELSDGDDRVDLPAGDGGCHSVKRYLVPDEYTTSDEALDWFHHNVPVGCLEEFSFDVLNIEAREATS